jgi:hypothetical protein
MDPKTRNYPKMSQIQDVLLGQKMVSFFFRIIHAMRAQKVLPVMAIKHNRYN